MKISLIIVNYNTFQDCCECVTSILDHKVVNRDAIVIVDNNSPDESGRLLANRFPEMKVILSNRNDGFGAGVNLGVNSIESDFYLILNPDTRFNENKIGVALDVFERESNLGVLGLHLEYSDGSHQDSARRFFSVLTILLRRTPLGRLKSLRSIHEEHLMTHYWSAGIFEADWVTGAAFIVRKTAFHRVGSMDEGYFLYLEDTDLCKRMWLSGWTVKAIPDVKLIHFHQRASAKSLFGKASRAFFWSVLRYWSKYGIPIFGHGRRV